MPDLVEEPRATPASDSKYYDLHDSASYYMTPADKARVDRADAQAEIDSAEAAEVSRGSRRDSPTSESKPKDVNQKSKAERTSSATPATRVDGGKKSETPALSRVVRDVSASKIRDEEVYEGENSYEDMNGLTSLNFDDDGGNWYDD